MDEIDVRVLTALDRHLLDSVAEGVFDHAVRPDLANRFVADPNNVIAVAVDAGVVVGMATGLFYVHPDKEKQLFINEVGVAPTHHRRGVATRLVEELLRVGRERGAVEAWVATEVDNAPARGLYQKLGGEQDPDLAVVYTYRLSARTPAGS